jgi:acyl transferase domain-containing protein
LWSLLKENRCGHGPVPPSRYNVGGFYHPDAEKPGSIHSNTGYFLDGDTQAFENAFFGINNMEVQSMDPQQRKLLEVVYEAFEDAGASLERLNGSKTGVYVGNFTNDQLIMQYQDAEYFTRYSATGSGPTLLSNRITHAFDLRGPSMTLDTACSSSLYALHLACQAIDAGDCDGAVVASANLIQSPEQQLIAVKAGILSPDAFCHTFDKSANGYGRAEGVVAIYLKRLDHAMRDGDSIRAVIKGTAVNGHVFCCCHSSCSNRYRNGKTQGISQPSIAGQEEVIRSAYERACLRPEDTVYVEVGSCSIFISATIVTHGTTGTRNWYESRGSHGGRSHLARVPERSKTCFDWWSQTQPWTQ